MSAAYLLVFDQKLNEPGITDEAFSGFPRQVARFAQRAGVASPDDFVSYSPSEAADMIEAVGGEVPEELPAASWFDAEAGRAWVRDMKDLLANNEQHPLEHALFLTELDELDQALKLAGSSGARWRLIVDI